MNLFLKKAHHITGYVNNFDAPVLYTCLNGGYLNGVSSVHDNKKEDRRYRFRCCTPKSGKFLPDILFFKTTKEFNMIFWSLVGFCFMMLFCLPPLYG